MLFHLYFFVVSYKFCCFIYLKFKIIANNIFIDSTIS